jgi:4-amino-4-deoxy-L-arabinose transferase-like glycosyltransferase
VVTVVSPETHEASLSFTFRALDMSTGQVVFALGQTNQWLSASISNVIAGQRYVMLNVLQAGHPALRLTLVSHVQPGRTYAVEIVLGGSDSLLARVDGKTQFSYSLPSPIPASVLGTVRVGAGPLPSTAFRGFVDGFQISYLTTSPVSADTAQQVLWLVSGLASALMVVLIALQIALSAWRSGMLSDSRQGPRFTIRAVRFIGRHSLAFGAVVLSVGILLLALATPLDNMVVHQTGSQTVLSRGVGPGGSTSYYLGDTPRVANSAAAVDMDISFSVRTTAPLPTTPVPITLVSTFNYLQGVRFDIDPGGTLVGTLIGAPGLLYVSNYPLVDHLPLNQWTTIGLEVQRSQSYTFYVNGHPLQSFTWALPIVRPAPAQLSITAPAAATVKNVGLRLATFQVPSSGVHGFLIRLVQIIGIIGIIGGVILIARRLFSRVVPLATSASSSLVRVTFVTAGVGELINILVDLMHFQHSNLPYFERNTWLLSRYPRFTDFFQVLDIFKSRNPYGIQSGNYPPLGYWLASPFAWFNEYAGLLIFLSLCIGFIVWWTARSFATNLTRIEQVGVVIVTLLSVPVTFAVDRGNFDLVIFMFTVFGIAAFERGRNALSSVWLGIGAAAKGFPALFFLLFLRGRRMRYLLLGVAVAAITTFAAVATFHGSLSQNIEGLRTAESSMQGTPVVASTYYNASLVGWAQSIGYALNGSAGASSVHHALTHITFPVDLVGGLALLWYVTRRETSLWRSVSLISIASLLFFQVSNYYEMLLLLIPMSLFFRHRKPDPPSIVIAVLFGLLLAPKAYFYFGNFVETSVLVTAPLLVVLAIAIIRDGQAARRGPTDRGLANHDATGHEVELVTTSG